MTIFCENCKDVFQEPHFVFYGGNPICKKSMEQPKEETKIEKEPMKFYELVTFIFSEGEFTV